MNIKNIIYSLECPFEECQCRTFIADSDNSISKYVDEVIATYDRDIAEYKAEVEACKGFHGYTSPTKAKYFDMYNTLWTRAEQKKAEFLDIIDYSKSYMVVSYSCISYLYEVEIVFNDLASVVKFNRNTYQLYSSDSAIPYYSIKLIRRWVSGHRTTYSNALHQSIEFHGVDWCIPCEKFGDTSIYYNTDSQSIDAQLNEFNDSIYVFDHSEDLDKLTKINTYLHEHTHKCKDCGKLFIIGAEHESWYTQKGLSVPKRCPECIEKRKRGRIEVDTQ